MAFHALLVLLFPDWRWYKLEIFNVAGSEAGRRNLRHLWRGLRARVALDSLDFVYRVFSKWHKDHSE